MLTYEPFSFDQIVSIKTYQEEFDYPLKCETCDEVLSVEESGLYCSFCLEWAANHVHSYIADWEWKEHDVDYVWVNYKTLVPRKKN